MVSALSGKNPCWFGLGCPSVVCPVLHWSNTAVGHLHWSVRIQCYFGLRRLLVGSHVPRWPSTAAGRPDGSEQRHCWFGVGCLPAVSRARRQFSTAAGRSERSHRLFGHGCLHWRLDDDSQALRLASTAVGRLQLTGNTNTILVRILVILMWF